MRSGNNNVKIRITNFKSIRELQIELGARVAVFLGPPGAGKTNILEALALYGYAAKAMRGEPALHLNRYIRAVQCYDIHHYGNPSPATVELAGGQESSAALQLVAECKSPTKAKITVGGGVVEANFYVPREPPAVFPNAPRELQLLLSMLYAFAQQEPPYEVVRGGPADVVPRLYSFDQLGVAANIALGLTDATAPHYLDEWGRNLGRLLYREGKLAERINAMLSDLAGIEVRPLHNGKLAFFDGGREVGPSSVSDTVLRMLYLAAALLTAGEGDVIMLDDPEAHVYPRAFVYLPDLIKEASEKAHVLVATHSGPSPRRS